MIIDNVSNPVGCTITNKFRLLTTAVNYEVIASALLTAITLRKAVQLWTSACDSDGASIIISVQIAQ